jgi:hypothetical protein
VGELVRRKRLPELNLTAGGLVFHAAAPLEFVDRVFLFDEGVEAVKVAEGGEHVHRQAQPGTIRSRVRIGVNEKLDGHRTFFVVEGFAECVVAGG